MKIVETDAFQSFKNSSGNHEMLLAADFFHSIKMFNLSKKLPKAFVTQNTKY